MLARQRQERILEALRASGGVRVSDLTEQLQRVVHDVRRDLDALAERGLIDKVHGGATIAGQRSTDEPGFEAKSVPGAAREGGDRRGPRPAGRSRGPRSRCPAGTTTWALARHLRDVPDLTVVTNSVRVAEIMRQRPGRTDLTVVLTGGLRTPSDALVGPVADMAIALAARRPAVHGRARDGRARRLHDAEPAGGRDQPARCVRRRGGSWWSPTTRSGAWSG